MSSRSDSRILWVLLALAALLPFAHLGHPLWEVDDARYAEVPREMVERGDWITPSLNYLDYVEKPPLPYWLTAVSYTAFGVSEKTAHLPLALWAFLALAATAWLGSWAFDRRTGLTGAVLLGTSVAFIGLSHLATPDLPLTAMLAWTTAFWYRAMRRPEDALWAGTLAGACMGLSVLCKGLVGAVFPAAWAAALALTQPELRPGLARSLKSGLVPAFLLTAVPWFAAMENRHPGFLRFVIGEQHFERFLSGATKYRRAGPPWYFIPVELLGAVPWTPLIGAAFWSTARSWRSADPGLKALALWALGVFAFFSISSSKLPTYILPIFPQQCLLAAAFLNGRGPGSPDGGMRGLAMGLGLILVLAVPVVPIALGRVEGAPLPAGVPWLAGGALSLLALGTLGLALPGGLLRLVVPATGACLGAVTALAGARSADPWVSARPLAKTIAQELSPGDRILSYGVFLHGIPFYTGQPVDPVNWVGELHYAMRDPAALGRFGDDDTIRALPDPDRSVFVALRRKEAEWFTSLNPGAIGEMRTFGPWALAKFRAPKRGRAGPKG